MLKKYRKKRFSRSKQVLYRSAALLGISLLYTMTNYFTLSNLTKNLAKYIYQYNTLNHFLYVFQDTLNSNRIMNLNSSFIIDNELAASKTAYVDLLVLNNVDNNFQDVIFYIRFH